jgi:hypothetical protein
MIMDHVPQPPAAPGPFQGHGSVLWNERKSAMKIIVDIVDAAPPHALTLKDIKALLRMVPKEWKLWLRIVHLKATLPEHSRFARPVIYSFLGGPRLNVCCRGLSADRARREILRELAVQGLRVPLWHGHRLSDAQLKHIDEVIAPLLEKARAEAESPALILGS